MLTEKVDCLSCHAYGTMEITRRNRMYYCKPPLGWYLSLDGFFLCGESAGGVDPAECESDPPKEDPPKEGALNERRR